MKKLFVGLCAAIVVAACAVVLWVVCGDKIAAWFDYQCYKHRYRQRVARNVDFTDTLRLIPTLSICTEADVDRFHDRDSYKEATLSVKANGFGEDMDVENIRIRLRGNSTSWVPKAAYNLKLGHKRSLCGLRTAKSFVLLANAFDRTQIHTLLGLRMAHLLGVEYTPNAILVNLMWNGKYHGLYTLIEKVDIGPAAVDIDKHTDVIMEIDTRLKRKHHFRTSIYNLPVNIKEPDFDKQYRKGHGLEPSERLAVWQKRVGELEQELYNAVTHPNDTTTLFETLDLNSAANYFLLYSFINNGEINAPFSLYIYTTDEGSRFHFGPVWDLDLTFGIQWPSIDRRQPVDTPFCAPDSKSIYNLLLRRKEFRSAMSERWSYFRTECMPHLLASIDSIGDFARPYFALNSQVWPIMGHPQTITHNTPTELEPELDELRTWIIGRAAYFDKMTADW